MTAPADDDWDLDDPRTRGIVQEALAVRGDPCDTEALPSAAVLPAWVPARPFALRAPRGDLRRTPPK